jgi:hypothetical protein
MTQLDRVRLAKLLAMLGSAHDGEIAAAGRAAEKLRRTAKLTWLEILTAAGRPHEDRRQIGDLLAQNDKLWDRIARLERENATLKANDTSFWRHHAEMVRGRDQRISELKAENEELRKATFALPPDDVADVLTLVMPWKEYLAEWERGFVDGLIRKRKRRLDPKESAMLSGIVDKISVYRRHVGNGGPA